MKQLTKLSTILTTFVGIIILTLLQLNSFAQDSTKSGSGSTSSASNSTTSTTTTTETWYTQPWVWIVGGAVLLLIIIALVRGNNTDRVTNTHTSTKVIKERDIT